MYFQMSKHKVIFIIGIILILMPFLGFPSSWESVFEFVFGVALSLIALAHFVKSRKYGLSGGSSLQSKGEQMFVENKHTEQEGGRNQVEESQEKYESEAK